MSERPLTSGELASAAGVGPETLRFYERRGLLPEPPRRVSGRRAWPTSAVTRLRFIRSAKEAGFTLAEIRELLELRVDAEQSCAEVRGIADARLAQVRDQRLDALGFGEFAGDAVFAGEGQPAPDVDDDHSLSRDRRHIDSDDNVRDFNESDPSPGRE